MSICMNRKFHFWLLRSAKCQWTIVDGCTLHTFGTFKANLIHHLTSVAFIDTLLPP